MKPEFLWLSENVELPYLDYSRVEKWIVEVAKTHGFQVRRLSYLFCDDSKIIEVNRRFLQHDYFTDIITFDDCKGRFLRGDMVISLDTVASNAHLLGVNPDEELLRVIIHGVLHLCGINDKGPCEREIMEAYENEALKIFNTEIKY